MHEQKRRRAREAVNAIREVLLKDWDPIGVSDIPEAQDEYDDYVGGVHRLLVERASREEIATHLHRIELGTMGLSMPGPERLLPVADKLLAINLGHAPDGI